MKRTHVGIQEGAFEVFFLLLTLGSFSGLIYKTWDPTPDHWGPFTLDRLSALLALLVGFVGLAVYRFSLRYLDGEPRKSHFLNRLAWTALAAYLFMISTHLLWMWAAWTLTSLGLHRLLTFYQDRPEALPAARKKFLISRLGDLALIGAIGLIWFRFHTFDLPVFLDLLAQPEEDQASNLIAILITLAALTKSAQFPFHSWLPETMESPTPVSALMHAGIINAGGALLLRFSPLISRSPISLILLSLIGTLTLTLGLVSMWAQVKTKTSLAWSTVSQMGFMMVQCGLGVYPAAALHIVGHGFYKAWSFLRSGTLPSPQQPSPSPWRNLWLAVIGTLAALPALVYAAELFRFDLWRSPGEAALMGVAALSIGQLWVALLRTPSPTISRALFRLAETLMSTAVASVLAAALYRGAQLFFDPVFNAPPPISWGAIVAAIIPLITLAFLVIFHTLLPMIHRTRFGKALPVYAVHGFYFGAIADRWVEKVWMIFSREEKVHD